jgi:type IV pilus assembly protein PilB
MIDPSQITSNSQRMALQGLPARLIQDGLLDEKTALQAISDAKDANTNLVAHLVARGIADAREIAIAASQEFGVPLLDLDAFQPDLDVVRLVSDKLLQKHRVLPLARRGKRLFVAVSDPTNVHALDEIKFQTSMAVEAVVVEEDKLQKLAGKTIEQVDTQMPDLGSDDVDLEGLDVTGGDEDELGQAAASRDDVEDAPIVRFVNKILLDAIKKGASDIHFEPYEKIYRIRLRIDGYLKEIATPPVALAYKLAARVKVMSRLDIAERRIPQDGRMKMRISKTRAIDFRVSTCPTLFGEKIVARILDPSSAMLGIDVLGYEPFQKDLYMQALARPHGMILVTGPTGSGKTVSLYTGLNILNKEDTNISTAEDPAEINLPGVNQVNVNAKVGLTFAAALRAFLRQDPDVIMVGEIRDLETAEIAIKASQTGHLVLSTLHTNDAPRTLSRMVDMGVQPYAIATSVALIIAQRLARKLCSHCKTLMDVPSEALRKEGFNEADIASGMKIYKAVGCGNCSDGYKGRVGIYQVMPITETISRIILRGGDALEIAEQAEKDGVWDLRRAAMEKVKNGLTSLDEMNTVTVE